MDIISPFKSFIKMPNCTIDNNVFKLHYRVSCMILFMCSVLVTARQYFGDPIDCISRDDIPNELLDTFCWVHTTFSVVDSWNKTVGVEVPYPGVDKYFPGERRVYHAYYQWVCFVLFFQAILFYLPHYLWKAIENGRIKAIRSNLCNPILKDKERDEQKELLIKYLNKCKDTHQATFYLYCLCEFLNLLNVLAQMIMMDKFLGGQFTTYGWQVLQFTEWDFSVRYDPMIRVFPRLTKCTFHRYGSSGDVQRHDAMCILPINIINEKIYIFLWFWFYLLAIITFVAFIYRMTTITSKRLRIYLLHKRCISVADRVSIVDLVGNIDVGDW